MRTLLHTYLHAYTLCAHCPTHLHTYTSTHLPTPIPTLPAPPRYSGVFKFHVLVTTYEIVLQDLEILQDIHWRAIVVDEAHRSSSLSLSLSLS